MVVIIRIPTYVTFYDNDRLYCESDPYDLRGPTYSRHQEHRHPDGHALNPFALGPL